MKKKVFLLLFILISSIGYSQNIGLGFHSLFYTHGVSAKFKINDHNAIQGIVNLSGQLNSYSSRYLRSFNDYHSVSLLEFQPYIVGMISLHKMSLINDLGYNSFSRSFGYGVGGGVSWSFISFDSLEISNEIALTTVVTGLPGYKWSYFHFGIGLHYFFSN